MDNKTPENAQSRFFNFSILDEFRELSNRLSPENLHQDGEISQVIAEKKRVQISKAWKVLEGRLGREVSEYEVWKGW